MKAKIKAMRTLKNKEQKRFDKILEGYFINNNQKRVLKVVSNLNKNIKYKLKLFIKEVYSDGSYVIDALFNK